MKKILFILFSLLVSMTAFAGNPIVVKSGADAFKAMLQENEKAKLVLDWTGATFDDREALTDRWDPKDYEFVQQDCPNQFAKAFNKKSKGLKLTATDEAKYTIHFKIAKVDSYFAVMSLSPTTSFEGKVWGTMTVTNNETGEQIAEFEIVEAEDGKAHKYTCFGQTFRKLAERLVKLK